MLKFMYSIVLLMSCVMLNAQKSIWTVQSEGEVVTTSNLKDMITDKDSLIVRLHNPKKSSSTYPPLWNVEKIGDSLTISQIKRIDADTYLLIGIVNGLNSDIKQHLLVLNNREIAKYLIINTTEKLRHWLSYLYIEKDRQLLISKSSKDGKGKYLYEINLKKNRIAKIKPSESIFEVFIGPNYYTKDQSKSPKYDYKVKL